MTEPVKITAVLVRATNQLDKIWIKHGNYIRCFQLGLLNTLVNADSLRPYTYYIMHWQDWNIGKIKRIGSSINPPQGISMLSYLVSSKSNDGFHYKDFRSSDLKYRCYLEAFGDYSISYWRVPPIFKKEYAWHWPKSFRTESVCMIRLVKLRGGPKDIAMLIITELAKIYSWNG
jgi:hypothetical protein